MRARLLKPGFFTNERLARLPVRARLLFAGLWCLADREGRLEYRPERIRAAIFPYEPRVKIEALIRALELEQFVKRYTSAHTRCLALPRFAQHQHPHVNEPESKLPAPSVQSSAEYGSRPADPVTRSGIEDQDQELTAAARQFSVPPFKVYAAIATNLLDMTADLDLEPSWYAEEMKRICAKQALPYDATIVQKALDAAQVARARRRA
jgi:hypothetical protein